MEVAFTRIKLGTAPGVDNRTPEMLKFKEETGKESFMVIAIVMASVEKIALVVERRFKDKLDKALEKDPVFILWQISEKSLKQR